MAHRDGHRFLGSGKTTLIRRLLRDPDMADTVVIVNEFGEAGLDHHLLKAATDDVILLPNGCLCCSIQQNIVHTLRDFDCSSGERKNPGLSDGQGKPPL